MDSVCALICEYNPFHKGHKYQIDILKKEFNHIICIMSGTTVQRGDFAIADKYIRAKAAVLEGASIVLELPYPYSSLGARDFAASGVHIAASLGIPNLAFGAEDDYNSLKEIVALLSKGETIEKISLELKKEKNLSYPQIRELVISEKLGYSFGEMLSRPNNILGIEYMLAGGDRFNYHIVKRNNEYKNASSIRNLPKSEMEDELPQYSGQIFRAANHRSIKNLELAILSKLRISRPEDLNEIYDILPGFALRINRAAITAKSLDELINQASSKTDTKAKMRRAILHCFIGGTKIAASQPPLYTNLLAARRESLYLLKEKKEDFAILSKPAHYKRLSNKGREQFELAAKAELIGTLSSGIPETGELYLKSTPFII